MTRKGGLEEDVRSRLRKGETAFSKLRNIWKRNRKLKVIGVPLYGRHILELFARLAR